jgi:hypothetical protein
MPVPAWFLLFWSGLAATCTAALVGSALGGRTPGAWALVPRHRSTAGAAAATLLAGLLIYPAIYGAIFEVVGDATALTGLMAGSLHAIAAFALARRSAPTRDSLRTAFQHLLYAVVVGFLYVTP